MMSEKARISRRAVVAAAAFAAGAIKPMAGAADGQESALKPASIRPSTIRDLPRMLPLLIAGCVQRRAMNPALWPLAADASAHIEAAVRTDLEGPHRGQTVWRVAETGGRLVGLTHAVIVPVPPIYAVEGGSPGLFLDDCMVADDAPAASVL